MMCDKSEQDVIDELKEFNDYYNDLIYEEHEYQKMAQCLRYNKDDLIKDFYHLLKNKSGNRQGLISNKKVKIGEDILNVWHQAVIGSFGVGIQELVIDDIITLKNLFDETFSDSLWKPKYSRKYYYVENGKRMKLL